jgi:hypothetical protein
LCIVKKCEGLTQGTVIFDVVHVLEWSSEQISLYLSSPSLYVSAMGKALALLCSYRKGQASFTFCQNFYCYERAFISSVTLDILETERNSSPPRQKLAAALIITVLVFYVMKVKWASLM